VTACSISRKGATPAHSSAVSTCWSAASGGKIEPDPQDATMIKTVRSGGYLFTPTVDAVHTPGKRLIIETARFF